MPWVTPVVRPLLTTFSPEFSFGELLGFDAEVENFGLHLPIFNGGDGAVADK